MDDVYLCVYVMWKTESCFSAGKSASKLVANHSRHSADKGLGRGFRASLNVRLLEVEIFDSPVKTTESKRPYFNLTFASGSVRQ